MTESEEPSPSSSHDATPDDGAPRKRKRKRRRGKKRSDVNDAASADGPTPTPIPATPQLHAAVASLTAGLFSHLDDREEPCRVDGCHDTWTFTAQEQIQAFGQPPPKRMCAMHSARMHDVADRAVPCANAGCTRTWTFSKSAQIAQIDRTGSAEPPRRVCDECIREEKQLQDREVPCRLDACKRTWTWSRDAQLKHRAWLRRHGDEGDVAPSHPADDGRRKRRRKRRASIHEPPPRLCEPCKAKLATLVERESPCKVHGCTKMAMIDPEQQLRGWAALGTDDPNVEAPLGRRMCDACREFCRAHPDREVRCGRPGCDKTWTYKTGAQLQAMLAGRHEDPIRLCPDCATGEFVRESDGAEIMPCVVPLCDGVWYYQAGTPLARTEGATGELPIDRMCPACREQRQPADPNAVESLTAGSDV